MEPDALSPEETATLIDYARRKYAEERWPLSPELRPVREAIEKLRAQPVTVPPKPQAPSLVAQRMRKRR